MNKTKLRQIVLSLTAAVIWGFAFSFQDMAAEHLGALSINASRFLVGGVALSLVMKLVPRFAAAPAGSERLSPGEELRAGILCGLALAVAAVFQQLGIEQTTAGKASFITTLYVVLVPLGGILFLHHRVRPRIWFCVALAVCGLYFISMKEDFTIARGDILIVICAFCFTVQMLLIAGVGNRMSGMKLSCIQFYTVAAVCGVLAVITEQPSLSELISCLGPILYLGLLSSGVGYTFQTLAEQDGETAVVSILLSMESVFGALGGYLILHQSLSLRELFGCGLMLAAVLISSF